MPRRVRLPGADELFGPSPATESGDKPAARTDRPLGPVPTGPSGPSGRVRHEEKITVYVTPDELFHLEQTRLTMRREHGLAVDRGRLVREAIHLALEAAESEGSESALVRRLREP